MRFFSSLLQAKEIGVPASVELCVKALQLPKQDDSETRISVCKTVSCLLSDDLEVIRACLLTEFLLGPCQEAFGCLEELYLRPDQKFDQENEVIPNSLRCELLLALKAHWPFDPEFWDWKTLKYHCISLLGVTPESEGEEEEVVETQQRIEPPKTEQVTATVGSEHQKRRNGSLDDHQLQYKTERPSSPENQRESPAKQQRFSCRICRRSITDLTQAVHHSKRHAQVNCHPCPVCLEKFQSRKDLVPHMKMHVHGDTQAHNSIKKEAVPSRVEEDDEIEPGEITVDPSLMLYYKSTHDPDVLQHIMQQAKSVKDKHGDDDEHITFDYIYQHFKLQNRDEYQCPGTGCPRIFKHSKYLYVHLKSEHKGDENVKHFHQMRDRREKCLFCRRHLVSAHHHRKHKRAHCGDTPYACVVVGCGAQFCTSQELVVHKQTHGYQLNYQCELKGCYVTYSDLGQIYHHEAQHFRDAAFTCVSQECRKYFFSKQEFIKHLSTHNITFSEEDLEAQRKAKRKRFRTEVTPEPNKSVHTEVAENDVLNSPSDVSDSALQVSDCKEPKATMTLVAVCFDGSKFTCGFEKCGMSFSRARDVQRHLKCAHPEHLKLENKEHLNDKGHGPKTAGVKAKSEPDAKGKVEVSTQLQLGKLSKDKKECTQTKISETNISSPQTNDVLGEILIGLSNLDLNSASPHVELSKTATSVENSESKASLLSPFQPVVAEPSFVVLGKPPKQPEGEEKKKMEQKIEANSEDVKESRLETSTESLANAKPYNCEVKGCNFRTAQSYSLLRHYNTKHGRTVEQAKRLTSLKTTSFKPYMCHLCPKSHREKHVLKAHYIQAHNLSESLVDKISYASVQHDGNKCAPRELTTSAANKAELPREVDKKNFAASDGSVQNGDSHAPSEEDGEDEQESQGDVCELKGETDECATHQVRARRLVAKSNLCYILDKFSKPFHCVAKNCDAAFSTQGGLVRHLQLVHHYNRSQLLLETDVEQIGAEPRKETAKKRPPPNTDEPQPQHRCHFARCKASYHLKSSLVRHTRDCHSQPPEPIRCTYEGCAKVFSHNEALRNHMLYNHCEYYNSLVVRLQSTQNKSVTGCQKKLIVAPQSPQKDESDLNDTEAKLSSLEPEESVDSTETPKEGSLTDKVPKSKSGRKLVSSFTFRSHEEALQMCQDRCLRVAYPCMVQDCDSVVTYLGSLHRHYLKVHRMGRLDILKNEDKLILNAEQLEEMIQRKSARPTTTEDATPNGVPEKEKPQDQENLEGLPPPVSDSAVCDSNDVDHGHPLEVSGGTEASENVDVTHCLTVPGCTDSLKVIEKTDPLGIPSGTDPLKFPEVEQEEAPVVERNGVLLGADEVLYGEPSTGDPTGDSITATQTVHKSENKLSWEKLKPLLRPVTVDLSLPCTLLTTSVEALPDTASFKDGSKRLNGSVLSIPPVRQPLKRKNELSEQPANFKDAPSSNPPAATFAISSYKPASFESSFLKFIQDTAQKNKTASQAKYRDSSRRGCSVKENNQRGISHTRSRRNHSSLKSNTMTGDLASAQNLKSILDKALAGCGDLAIKQLQYLRPVVVLERPTFINIPQNSTNSKLLLGS